MIRTIRLEAVDPITSLELLEEQAAGLREWTRHNERATRDSLMRRMVRETAGRQWEKVILESPQAREVLERWNGDGFTSTDNKFRMFPDDSEPTHPWGAYLYSSEYVPGTTPLQAPLPPHGTYEAASSMHDHSPPLWDDANPPSIMRRQAD
jgi:hypothetical protein